MNRLVAAVAVVVVAGGAVGAASVVGLPWADGPSGEVPTTTAVAPDGASDGGAAATTTDPPPFVLHIDDIESCGQTCRDVTATLVNTRDQQATGVFVVTTIHAGESTDGDVVWEGDREVGAIPGGASVEQTSRIELGFMDAAAVQGAGGDVTIVTRVESDQETVRFVRHRDVS